MMVLVDSGAFYAFADRDDAYHCQAFRQWGTLLQQKTPLVVTNHIVDETYTLIRRRLGFRAAVDFLAGLRESEQMELLKVVTSDAQVEAEAEALLKKYDDQDLSYTDAVSLAMARRLQVRQIFSFDRHLQLEGAELIPSPAVK